MFFISSRRQTFVSITQWKRSKRKLLVTARNGQALRFGHKVREYFFNSAENEVYPANNYTNPKNLTVFFFRKAEHEIYIINKY